VARLVAEMRRKPEVFLANSDRTKCPGLDSAIRAGVSCASHLPRGRLEVGIFFHKACGSCGNVDQLLAICTASARPCSHSVNYPNYLPPGPVPTAVVRECLT
jgi:hypothetical protein